MASAAATGEVAVDRTPLQRSPVALRVAAAGAPAVLGAVASLPRAFDVALALERVGAAARTGVVLGTTTRAAAPPALRVCVLWAGAERGAESRFGATVVEPRVVPRAAARVAPLTVAEALDPAPLVAGAGAVPGGGVAPADAGAGVAVGGETTGGGVVAPTAGGGVPVGGAGGAAGEDGVPKPEGVHAQASPAPATATPSIDKTAKQTIRTCRCIAPSSILVGYMPVTPCLQERSARCNCPSGPPAEQA
ncbi:MAG: hypothetical protein ACLGI5_12740 [Thermoleophilia bacterium]